MFHEKTNGQAEVVAKHASLHSADKLATEVDPSFCRARNGSTKAANADPFDPEELRLSQDFGAHAAVEKVLTTVPCRKPRRQEFVRVRSGEEWRLETAILEDQIGGETYLVNPKLLEELACEVIPVCLLTAITRQNDLFLWRLKLPVEGGRSNAWNDSALAAARQAEHRWVRVSANLQAGYYDVFQASGDIADPMWPDFSFRHLLSLAFKDRYIDQQDHPLLRELRGEV